MQLFNSSIVRIIVKSHFCYQAAKYSLDISLEQDAVGMTNDHIMILYVPIRTLTYTSDHNYAHVLAFQTKFIKV